ncbi:MAG: glycosyl hydrolase [bacterium]
MPTAKSATRSSATVPRLTKGPVTLLLGTQKGAWTLKSDATRSKWTLSEPMHFGNIVNHVVADPRDGGKSLVMAIKTGHLGPTVMRSSDGGKTWTEAAQPPKFPEKPKGKGESVETVFWIQPGHASEPKVWYAGICPAGLFRSEDGGNTWAGIEGWNANKNRKKWLAFGGAPGGQMLHSILIDPRDKNHIVIGISIGGTFETRDQGKTWKPLNKGVVADFIPTPDPEFGHDPHCMVRAETNPDRLYMQNHCGLYRLDRPSKDDRWERIGDNMPREIGDVGFPVAAHPRNADKVWVVPMDGTQIWPRTSVDGKPAVYVSTNAGAAWKRLDKGFPKKAWWTVFRQALATDAHETVGLYFGTTSGEMWSSVDEGKSWQRIAEGLPRILSVEVR